MQTVSQANYIAVPLASQTPPARPKTAVRFLNKTTARCSRLARTLGQRSCTAFRQVRHFVGQRPLLGYSLTVAASAILPTLPLAHTLMVLFLPALWAAPAITTCAGHAIDSQRTINAKARNHGVDNRGFLNRNAYTIANGVIGAGAAVFTLLTSYDLAHWIMHQQLFRIRPALLCLIVIDSALIAGASLQALGCYGIRKLYS